MQSCRRPVSKSGRHRVPKVFCRLKKGRFIASRSGNTRFYALHHYQGAFQLGYGGLVKSSVFGMRNVKYTLNSKFTQGEQTMTVDGTVVARGTAGK